MKSSLGVTRPANMCTICTWLKSTNPEISFAADSLRVYIHSLLYSQPREKLQDKAVRYAVYSVQGTTKDLNAWNSVASYATEERR